MWYIYNIINGIKKRKIQSMLIVLQIVASFVLLLFSINLIRNIVVISDSKNWIINTEDLYEVNVEYSSNYNYDIIYDELKKQDNIEIVATYDLLFYGTEEADENFLTIDEEMYKLFNKIEKNGEKFNNDDFKEINNKDVFIGSSYKDKYEVNSSYVFSDANTYTVKGNIVDNKLFVTGRQWMYLDMNKVIIVPVERNDYTFNNILVKFKENSNIPKSIELSSGINVNFINVKDMIMNDIKDSIDSNKYTIIMALAGSVFCIIGITISAMFSIYIRKKEIGIRFAIGESKLSVFLGITIENIFISLIGGICAVIYYVNWYKDFIISNSEEFYFGIITIQIDFNLLFTTFLFLAAVVIISSLLTFIFTKKLEPKELMGGMH